MPLSNNKHVQLLWSFISILIATAIVLIFRPNFITATLLFFGLPSAYLAYLKPSNLKKAFASGALFGLLWGFPFDLVAEYNNAWAWSTGTSLLYSPKILGIVSPEILLWFFLWVFSVVIFYEHFCDRESRKISRNIRPSIYMGAAVFILVTIIFFVQPALLQFKYAYLVLGCISVLPFLYLIYRKPRIVPKLLSLMPFFILLYLSFELVALYLNLWSFPGHYIGYVSLFNLQFTFEEFLFWIIASSAVTASYHELFVDDQK